MKEMIDVDYQSIILEKLIAAYEKRGLYDHTNKKSRQSIFLYVEKLFPEYTDNYDGTTYREINEAIDYLLQLSILSGKKDARGNYQKLRLLTDKIQLCYKLAEKVALGDIRQTMKQLLTDWDAYDFPLLEQFRTDQLERLAKNRAPEFGIGDYSGKLQDVLMALTALMKLNSETYIRNFSEAVFSDSKKFQKIRGSVERILCAYGGKELTRETVLESFNLLDNPVYILLKGKLRISFNGQSIYIGNIPGGIALPSMAIPSITDVNIDGSALITVENLTTFHDEVSEESAVLYLGGFHNTVRTVLLKKIYERNPDKQYFHKGDIDVYGFLILENLRLKTQIPFKPLEMDLKTLKEYEVQNFMQPLNSSDRKLLHLPQLASYRNVLSYMEQHNCKAEQESRQAIKLLRDQD